MRSSVTVIDALEAGACIEGVTKWVAAHNGLIEAPASSAPTEWRDRIMAAAFGRVDGDGDGDGGYGVYGGGGYGYGYDGYGYSYDGCGYGCGYCDGYGGYGYGYVDGYGYDGHSGA